MKFAELFAGAGGLSMGLERAGWSCVWHAEIADAPRAILAHRWPDVPLYGDVTTLNGNELTATHGAIDLLTGGSPCQDLSVAGKRAGLEGARSGLFFEQMRLWDETGADLCLWENVDGARSSNDGKDFGEVLRAFVGAAVIVPSDGWRSAGVAAGPTGVAAWRVLDAQFFGVPQRRRRVFVLGTRTGRIDPAEVLSLAEGMCRDSSKSGEAWEDVAADARASAPFAWNEENITNPQHRGGVTLERTSTLTQGGRMSVAYSLGSHAGAADAEVSNASHANGGPSGMGISGITAGEGQRNDWETCTMVVGTLDAREHGGGFPGSDGAMSGHVQAPTGVPRRLTPRECERLMSWPDDHTLVPDAKGKPLSDAARYKACGNGVASVHSHWIGWRLALALGDA
jgi:DNA (cytosine-5)-methyltransferase 1